MLGLPALCYLLATGPNYGSQVITGPDEPRYAAAARDMITSGDWVVPRYNGEVRLEKPILLYWSCAFFSLIFGVGPLACRLGPVLAGLGTVLVTSALGSRLYGRRAGLLAGLVLATSWYFPQIGRTVLSDMLLTFFVVSAIALLRVAVDEKRRGRWRLLLLGAYVCCGLAVLAKGPIGLVLPVGVMAAWLFWEGRPLTLVKLLPLSGTAVTCVVAGPWYAAVWLRGGEAAAGLNAFFTHENFERFFRAFDHLDRPWKYVLSSVPQGVMPWTLLLPAGVAAFLALGRTPGEPGKARRTTEIAFPMVWAGAVVGLFSATGQLGVWPWIGLATFALALVVVLFALGRERNWKWIFLAVYAAFATVVGWVERGAGEPGGTARAFYVLPAYPGLAIAAGWALDRIAANPGRVPWARRLALAVPALVGVALLVLVSRVEEYRAQPGFAGTLLACGVLCAGASVALFVLLFRGKLTATFAAAALGLSCLGGFYWGWAIPMRDRVGNLGRVYVQAGERMADREAEVVIYAAPVTAEAVYYMRRPVRKITKHATIRQLREILVEKRPRYVVTCKKFLPDIGPLMAGRSRVAFRGRRKRDTIVVLAVDGAAVAPAP
ncbi:MAG: ArnT family glycosyltransferase [Planctomycetota bacterium]